MSRRAAALRAAAEEADPKLPDRERSAAELARFEEKIQKAAWKALRAWLRIASDAVLKGHVVTAAGDGIVPDPSSVAAHSEEWGKLVDQHIVGSVDDVLGERFGALLNEDQVVSARPWQEQYLGSVRNRMSDVPNQTFDVVRSAVQEGIDVGDGIPEIRDRISGVLSAGIGGDENAWLKRSQTIARTEVTGAYNGGHLAAIQARDELLGTRTEKVWLATIDSRTRDDHFQADGQRVPLDQPFDVGGEELEFPGDPDGPPEQTVNCRCTMLEVDAEDETPNTEDRQLADRDDLESELEEREERGIRRAFDDPNAKARQAAARATSNAARAAASAAAEKAAATAARRLEAKLAKQQDDAGVPMKLTFDYLGELGEDELDDLAVHLVSRLDDANPIEGQRWDDYEKFMDYRQREEQVVDAALLDRYASDESVTRAVAAFQKAEGIPGLTHPSVGGRGRATSGGVTRQEVQLEYAVHLEEQHVAAEAATRGHLFAPKYRNQGLDPRSVLFSGDPKQAARYASEELLEFWESNRRVSWSEFYYERTGSPGSARAAANQGALNARMDRDRSVLRADAGQADEPSSEQVAAYVAGRTAFLDGDDVLTVPYSQEQPDLLRLWIRGFVLARRDDLVDRLLAEADEPDDPAGVTAAATEGLPHMTRRTWRSAPVLAPFAKPTGDGRIFRVGSLTSRDLPLPLLYQESTSMGHDGSTTVGRILEVSFTDAGIVASGDYLDDPALAESVAKAIALVEAGLGGVSVDLDSVVGSLVDENGDEVSMEWLYEEWEKGENPIVYEQVDEGRLIGVTQVATPAFAEAAIELDPVEAPVGEESSLALQDSAGSDVEVGAIVTCTVPGDQIGGAREETDVEIRGDVTAVDEDASTVTINVQSASDGDPVEEGTSIVSPAASVTVVEPAPEEEDQDDAAAQVASLTAGAGTVFRPPAWAYENPALKAPTAITVTDEGRVYGHVAVWGTCHVGYPGQCVEPPKSGSDYSFFHVGAVRLDDGTRIAVGNLTLGGGHADPKLAWRQAAAHYDRTGFGIATVRAYEDEFGIAVAGWLNPGATEAQIAELERSPLSGDWREVGGELEMIGALAVNSGGFPIPRYATGADGDRLSLVAAPGVRPDSKKRPRSGTSLASLRKQLRKEVLADVRAELGRRQRLDRIVASVGLDARSRLSDVLAGLDD